MEQTKKKQIQFMLIAFVLTGLLFIANYAGIVNKYNATILSLNYNYGFICRGFIGTIYHFLDVIIPVDLLNYDMVIRFYFFTTLLFFALMIYLGQTCYKRANEEGKERVVFLSLLLLCVIVPSFSAEYNFGRIDLYMMVCSVIGALCILKKRCEFLVVPLGMAGVMFHEGYVLMYLNIILVLLFYRWMSGEKKYFILFALTFLGASALFLYFHFFSFSQGEEILREVTLNARRLCENGTYHISLVQAEILGVDLGETEIIYHLRNLLEFPCFVIFTVPLWLPLARFFVKLVKKGKTVKEKLKYLALAVGSLTLLPDFMFKVDFGRWILALIVYYIVVLLFLLAEKDETAMTCFSEVEPEGNYRYLYWIFMMGYMLCLTPFADVSIDILMGRTSGILNKYIFHFWLE